MLIKLLEDNTIVGSYDDDTHENINSLNYLDADGKSKALSSETEALVKIFSNKNKEHQPYNSADDLDGSIIFNGLTCVIVPSQAEENSEIIVVDPVEPLPTDERVRTFCEIVFTDGVREAFIKQLPTVPMFTEGQQVITVTKNIPNAIEQVLPVPEGEPAIAIVDGVAIATTVYERRRWVLKVFNEDGSEHMVSVQATNEEGEPLFEYYHKKTDTRFPIA